MGKFNAGDKIKLKYGGEVEVIEEIGDGGQGIVYKVKHENKIEALKWYFPSMFKNINYDKFKENLEKNIINGAPNATFLWPKDITEEKDGSFGYVMDIRPKEFIELTDFFLNTKTHPRQYFKSCTARIDAAINIVQAFRDLHNKGYTYQDLNNGSFFINKENGDVLICDNDNVSPYGVNLGILGKQRYMAPEIVKGGGKEKPDKRSDRFSLSVILFRLMFIHHPLEGVYSTPVCLTRELEKKYYGDAPIFVFDPNDNSNRPIAGVASGLEKVWNMYPQYFKDIFIKAFSKDVMSNPDNRIQEKEWLDVLMKFKAQIIKCPFCGEETFIDDIGKNKCINCDKDIPIQVKIKFSNIELPLFPTSKIYLWNVDNASDDLNTVLCQVEISKTDKSVMGLVNKSSDSIEVLEKEGKTKIVEQDEGIAIRRGLEIEFKKINCKGIII